MLVCRGTADVFRPFGGLFSSRAATRQLTDVAEASKRVSTFSRQQLMPCRTQSH